MDSATIQQESVSPLNKSFFIPRQVVIGILIGLGSLIIAGGLFFFFSMRANAATISGIINYTALKPDPGDKGIVQVKYRTYGSNGAYKIVYASALANQAPWSFTSATSGQPYEMVADLVIDNKTVVSSEPLIVTAPADDQTLNLHVTWHNLPADVVKTQTTSIKGNVQINGIIPAGSILYIQEEEAVNDNTFENVATVNNPLQQNTWSWNNTTPLADYNIRAVLMSGTQIIAESSVITAAGGDTAINFVLNSSAQGNPSITTPTPTAGKSATMTPSPVNNSITGTVQINGPQNANTSLLMLWRVPGTATYTQIQRITNPSNNGQSWSWTGLTPGIQYEVTAVLQVNNNNSATTQSQIITVPASNINFTLNTGVIVPTPSSNVNVLSCNNIGNNQYSATISFSQQSNAGNYWIEVGSTQAGTDIYNNTVTANGQNPQATFNINANQSYYAQYAYSLCTNCSQTGNYSNFSNSTPFSCGGGTAYTGYICSNNSCQLTTSNNPPYAFNNSGLQLCQQQCNPTPTNTPTPIPPTATPTPHPTHTPTPTPSHISTCNQSCGSNGYSCISGLSCVSGEGGVGSEVCRNPSCVLDQDCNCLTK